MSIFQRVRNQLTPPLMVGIIIALIIGCYLPTFLIIIIGVLVPAYVLTSKKENEESAAAQAERDSAEERAVRDFVERCRVNGMQCVSTSAFRPLGGESVLGIMRPAEQYETTTSTNLNMQYRGAGVLYATDRRFVYVAGKDVQIIPYNDVVKFHSDNLFCNGEVDMALASRRKRQQFRGPNSFLINIAFEYAVGGPIRADIARLYQLRPDDPSIEIFVQKLLQSQIRPMIVQRCWSEVVVGIGMMVFVLYVLCKIVGCLFK